ncbi:hypothetical protein B0J14DRAFT_577898, partial [Halenospora varia]
MAYNFSTQTSGECTMIPRPQSPMLWTPSECSTTTGVLSFESDFNMSETDASSELSSNDDTQIPECSTSTRAFSSESTSSAFDLVADTEMQEPENSTPAPQPTSASKFNLSRSDTLSDNDTQMAEHSTAAQQPSSPSNQQLRHLQQQPTSPKPAKEAKTERFGAFLIHPRHRTPDLIPTTTICVEKSRSRSYGNVEKDRRMRVYLLRTAEF